MAEIKPFRAWRYNRQLLKNISALTAPLFDVASEKHKAALYGNPYNSIHLCAPRGPRRIEKAAAALRLWRESGCLQQDTEPGIYVYFQYFNLPGDTRTYCRKGFICQIRVYDWDQKIILRHENTIPAAVDKQLKLLAATGLNASPTHGLYADEGFELEACMDESMDSVLCEAEDYQGIRNVLAVIRDPAVIQRFVDLMADKQVILADGHHRYAGSLAYMHQCRSADAAHSAAEACQYHMMWLTNSRAHDLKILPTHRLIANLPGFDETTVLKRLARYFILTEVLEPSLISEVIAGKKNTFGLIFAQRAFQARLKPGMLRRLRWNFPEVVKRLDLTVMHYFIIQEVLGIRGQDQRGSTCIEYERSLSLCLAKVASGQVQLALITNAVSIDEVQQVCLSGAVLPQKSTYFWPKAVCGLVFASI